MTDPKALIAEAREWLKCKWPPALHNADKGGALGEAEVFVRRLADALDEAQVPEGWRVVQYDRDDGASVVMIGERSWRAYDADENPVMAVVGTCSFHSTAREAMAALEVKDNSISGTSAAVVNLAGDMTIYDNEGAPIATLAPGEEITLPISHFLPKKP